MLSPGPAGAEAQEWTTLGRTLIGIRRGAGEVRRKVVAVIAVAIREARSGARIRLVGDPPARDRVPVLTVVGIEPVARELGDARGVAHHRGAPRDVDRPAGLVERYAVDQNLGVIALAAAQEQRRLPSETARLGDVRARDRLQRLGRGANALSLEVGSAQHGHG